ncbi:MAG: hypothetical protein JO129_01430 [Candidatus Dependentiae bacterium]|nr:hypothetical protein [Candidatus Dependentiae bacterium]
MNKKIILFFVLLCTSIQYASDLTPWLEIKPSYFFFSESPMNEIYDHGGFEIQGSASIPVYKYLDVYGSIGYRYAGGYALNSDEKTSLNVIPIDIGLKPVFKFDDHFHYFFAFGPRFFIFHQHNDALFINSSINGGGVGLFVNTGFNIEFADSFLLGIFGEYSYEKNTITSNRPNVYSNGPVQMGGFAFGVSLGYAF